MNDENLPHDDSSKSALARAVQSAAHRLSPEQRSAIYNWAVQVQRITSDASLSAAKKFEQLRALEWHEAAQLVLKVARKSKELAWDKRSLAGRFVLGGAVAGTLAAGGGWAGIAMLGGAFGVPAFLITAAGAALVGVIVQELAPK